jgi:ABC-type siderophore export system fused ATPase/permease subunit
MISYIHRICAFAVLLLAALATSVPALAAALTLQDAIAKVERETKSKILSAETRHIGKQTIYRIKVLTREGGVKVIEVPADSA